jgi:hypothetical protein
MYEKEAKVGDQIRAKGLLVTIGRIFYQEWYERSGWDIEFIDTDDNYRHWKQQFDGGELIQM